MVFFILLCYSNFIVFTQNKTLLLVLFNDLGLRHWCLFFGKKFGKNKLAKNISPGKTIEGALGGFICNIIFAFILVYLLQVDLSYDYFCILITGLSIFGDIYQSFLKRQAN